jgi:hypothetical protein
MSDRRVEKLLNEGLRDLYSSPNIILKNSVACVRERTIPTERPPLVGEVSDNI